MTPSIESPLKDPNSSDSTKEEHSHHEKSNLLSNSSSQENSPDTPSLKEPKPSPNTSNNDIQWLLICASFLSLTYTYLNITSRSFSLDPDQKVTITFEGSSGNKLKFKLRFVQKCIFVLKKFICRLLSGLNEIIYLNLVQSHLDFSLTFFKTKLDNGFQTQCEINSQKIDQKHYIKQQKKKTKIMLGVQSEVICSLCSRQYTDNNLPRILTSCGHTYCQLCISEMITKCISEEQADNGYPFLIECPEDGMQLKLTVKELKSFPKNHSLIKMLERKKINRSFKDQSFDLSKIAKKQQIQQDDETTDLTSAINQCKSSQNASDSSRQSRTNATSYKLIDQVRNVIQRTQLKTINQQIQEQEICLLHQKPLEIVCIIDNEKICSKCALFGRHKGHEFKTFEEVQRHKNQIYLSLLSVFKEKQEIEERMANSQTKSGLTQILNKKRDILEKQVRQECRKLRDQITKQEKVVLRKLQDTCKFTQKKILSLLKVDQKSLSDFTEWEKKSFELLKVLECSQLQPKVKVLYSRQLKNKDILSEGNQILLKIKNQQKNLVGKVQDILIDLECKKDKKIFQFVPTFVEIIQKSKVVAKSVKVLPVQQKKPMLMSKAQNKAQQKISPLNRTIIDDFDEKDDRMSDSPLLEQSLLQMETMQSKNPLIKNLHKSVNTFINPDIVLRLPLQSKENVINNKLQNDTISCNFIHLDLHSSKKEPPKTAMKCFNDERNDFMDVSRVSSVLTSRMSLVSKKQNGEKPNKKKLKNIKISQKYEKMLDGIYNNTVDTIDFTNAEVGDQTMAQICEFVKFSKARTIKFIRNKLTDNGIQKLLPNLVNAQILNLSQNNLTEAVIDIFIKHRFGYLSGLKNLILSQNKIIQRKHKAKIDQLRAMNIVVSV